MGIRVSPSQFITEELDARGWSVYDLCRHARRSPADLRAILDRHEPLTEWTARGIARAFGTSHELWLNLDRAFQAEVNELATELEATCL